MAGSHVRHESGCLYRVRIASRGPGTAMDFALILMERLMGKEQRLSVEAGLQR